MHKVDGGEDDGEDLAKSHQDGKNHGAKMLYGQIDEHLEVEGLTSKC